MRKLPPRATVGFACDSACGTACGCACGAACGCACGTDRNRDSTDIDLAYMHALFAKAPVLNWLALPVSLAIHLARQNIELPSKPLIFTQLDIFCDTEQDKGQNKKQNDIAYQAALETACARFRPVYLLAQLTLPAAPLTPSMLDTLDTHIARVQAHNRQFSGALLLTMPYPNMQEWINKEQAFETVAHVITDFAMETGCKLALNLTHLFMLCQSHKLRPRAFIEALKAETIGLIEMGDGIEAICHEVWVLYTHLLEQIGPRPTLIGTYRGKLSLPSLLADMRRADDRLNATRRLGPQLGASHVIFE